MHSPTNTDQMAYVHIQYELYFLAVPFLKDTINYLYQSFKKIKSVLKFLGAATYLFIFIYAVPYLQGR